MMTVLRKLHAWAGLALCLILAVLALSGSSLVFKPEWLRLTVPGADQVVAVTPQMAADALADAQAQFGAVRSVVFASPDIGLHQVNPKDGGGGYLRPDGVAVQSWGKNDRVVDWLFDLHHHLLNGETGQQVAGFTGLGALVLAITGLILWWPARRSFSWRITPGAGGGRAPWLSAHRNVGVIAAPVILVILMTGAPVALGEQTGKLFGFVRVKPPKAQAGAPNWPVALANAQARFPDAALRSAALPTEPGKPITVRLRQPREWHVNGRTMVHLEPATGRVLAVDDALKQAGLQQAYNAFWPVHASRVGGVVWKLTTLAGGLALLALSLYGGESYRRKLFPAKRGRRLAPAT